MIIEKETLSLLKEEYPVGTKIQLIKMDDCQAPPIGTKGTVSGYPFLFCFKKNIILLGFVLCLLGVLQKTNYYIS